MKQDLAVKIQDCIPKTVGFNEQGSTTHLPTKPQTERCTDRVLRRLEATGQDLTSECLLLPTEGL